MEYDCDDFYCLRLGFGPWHGRGLYATGEEGQEDCWYISDKTTGAVLAIIPAYMEQDDHDLIARFEQMMDYIKEHTNANE